MNLFKQQRSTYKQDIKNKAGGDKATADSILDLLFGTYYNDYDSEYVVTWEGSYSKEKNIWNRLAFLAILPFFVITIPFQWLLLGKVGVSQNSKFGRVILKLTGDYAEDD